MTVAYTSQPNGFYVPYFFEIGPRIQSLSFSVSEAKPLLMDFVDQLKAKVGKQVQLSAFPQRVHTQTSWKVHIKGDEGEVYLLLNISGRTQLPQLNEPWAARLNVELSDHVDAFWFVQFMMWVLSATWLMPTDLSSVFSAEMSDEHS